jgi:hypothetical protein
MKQIVYAVHEDYLGGEYFSSDASGNSSPYIRVTIDYTNYQTTTFSPTIFNTDNYFLMSGTVYTPQSPYGDYEVFLGSANLIK